MDTNFRNTPIENLEPSSISGQNTVLRASFAWMSLAMVLTAISAFVFASVPQLSDLLLDRSGLVPKLTTLAYVVMFAPLAFVLVIRFGLNKLSLPALIATFIGYSIVTGISLSFIFFIYTIGSIYTVFLSTAALFAVMAIAGYTTKTDLTKLGSLLMIGLVGIVIASLINLFMGNAKMDYIISILGVVIFTGLTAYDVQKIKNIGLQAGDSAEGRKYGILGALTLYLDFINLFMFLLRLFGDRK